MEKIRTNRPESKPGGSNVIYIVVSFITMRLSLSFFGLLTKSAIIPDKDHAERAFLPQAKPVPCAASRIYSTMLAKYFLPNLKLGMQLYPRTT